MDKYKIVIDKNYLYKLYKMETASSPEIISLLKSDKPFENKDTNPVDFIEIVADYGDLELLKKLLKDVKIIDNSVYYQRYEFDLDIDAFSGAIKNAILKEQFDIASYLLSMFEYNIYFTEEDQRFLIVDSSMDKTKKILKYCNENKLNFQVYDFTVDDLIETKNYDKLVFLLRNDYFQINELNLPNFIIKAFKQNDSDLIQLLCPYILPERIEEIQSIISVLVEKFFYDKLTGFSALKTFLRCQVVYENLNFNNMITIISIALETKDNEMYPIIVNHPLFTTTSNIESPNTENLVYQYLSAVSFVETPVPEMASYLIRSENYLNVIETALFSHIATNLVYFDFSIFELFVRDERNVLFNMLNVNEIKAQQGEFETADTLFDSLFNIENKQSYEKITLIGRMFMPRFAPITRKMFVYRLLELYNADETINKKIISDLFLSYGNQYEIIEDVLNAYYRNVNTENMNSGRFKIFELFNVDEIEQMIISNRVPYLQRFFESFTPRFTPSQVAFLYSKCRGKSRNRKEFIRTLEFITGKKYNIEDTDFMNFTSMFEYDDARQIFQNVVLGYVGLQNVRYVIND